MSDNGKAVKVYNAWLELPGNWVDLAAAFNEVLAERNALIGKGKDRREGFAAAALTGQLTNEQMQYADPKGLAANAVQLADALIAELDKEQT